MFALHALFVCSVANVQKVIPHFTSMWHVQKPHPTLTPFNGVGDLADV